MDFVVNPQMANASMGLITASIATVDTIVSFEESHPHRAWIRPLLISVGYFQFQFPQIVAFLPAGLESRGIFKQIGVPY